MKMKKIMAFSFSLLLVFAMAGCSSPSASEAETKQSNEIETETSTVTENNTEESLDMRVRLNFEGGEAIVRLEDNAAARDFASKLPMTQTFEDFNEIEKICRLPEDTTQITLTAGERVITAELDNSETSREFLATLPRTMEMNRYDDREYYGRMEEISENGTAIESFENGDLTYYPAGPSLAVFFDKEDTSRQGGLIRMGKITSDLSAFETMGETEEVLIEIAE